MIAQLTLEPDDGSILWAIRRGVCIRHRTRPGTPHDGDTTPYCTACKREHEQRQAQARQQYPGRFSW